MYSSFMKLVKGVIAVVGQQWGDEGKGKIIDWLAEFWADIIARGTGGANAGHTIRLGKDEHIFHLIPSGILSGKPNYIGSGVAVDPFILLSEMKKLDEHGVSYDNLKISHDARLVLPQHIIIDRARETTSGKSKFGTTGRGIGLVYSDHVARFGLRVVDLLNRERLREKLKRNLEYHSHELKQSAVKTVMKEDPALSMFLSCDDFLDINLVLERYLEFGRQLRSYIADTDSLIRQAVKDGKRVLLEGAQATLLSIDHGMYPMVTSSDSTVAGLAKGVGLVESQVDICFGIVKGPYMSKVGGGNFPTELGPAGDESFPDADINSENPVEQCVAIRKSGNEYGATTSRPRRVGWLDLPLLRYAVLFGVDELVLTKADVLDECKMIKICTHYIYSGTDEYDMGDNILKPGDRVDVAFGDDCLLEYMDPQYKEFPGWFCNISNDRSFDELPKKFRNIIEFIEEDVGKKFAIISVGPDREETIMR